MLHDPTESSASRPRTTWETSERLDTMPTMAAPPTSCACSSKAEKPHPTVHKRTSGTWLCAAGDSASTISRGRQNHLDCITQDMPCQTYVTIGVLSVLAFPYLS